MSPDALYSHVRSIREHRRYIPPKPARSTSAKATRAATKKSNPKNHDLFALARGMSQEKKNELAAALLQELMK